MPKPRSPRSALVNSLDQHRHPAYLLDENLRLVFGNEALQRWVGGDWKSLIDEVVGDPADNASRRARQWSRVLLPPVHCRQRPDLPFSLSAPEQDEAGLEADAPPDDQSGLLSDYEARVLSLNDGERDWYLIVLTQRHHALVGLPTRLLDLHRLWEQAQRHESDAISDLFAGDSAFAHRLREQVTLAARGAQRISVIGPTGSEHELVANWILHHRPESGRGPIATLECTFLDPELLQSTYRDLIREARGQDAPPGCLVLLNVDRLSPDGQLELLNLLRFPKVPLSTIVTSLKPLAELVATQSFDAELATRLDVISVELPALAARVDDLAVLAHATLQRACESQRVDLAGWSDAALARLQRHTWPGNYRELRSLSDRLSCECKSPWVQPSDLPPWFGQPLSDDEGSPRFRLREFRLEEFLKQCEAEIMRMALEQCGGNKTKAARLLGLSRGGFHRRMDSLMALEGTSDDSSEAASSEESGEES